MNVFERLLKYGHDEDFEPKPGPLHFPTKFSPGSLEKIEVLRQRAEMGLPLWHERDEGVCSVVNRSLVEKKQELGECPWAWWVDTAGGKRSREFVGPVVADRRCLSLEKYAVLKKLRNAMQEKSAHPIDVRARQKVHATRFRRYLAYPLSLTVKCVPE